MGVSSSELLSSSSDSSDWISSTMDRRGPGRKGQSHTNYNTTDLNPLTPENQTLQVTLLHENRDETMQTDSLPCPCFCPGSKSESELESELELELEGLEGADCCRRQNKRQKRRMGYFVFSLGSHQVIFVPFLTSGVLPFFLTLVKLK